MRPARDTPRRAMPRAFAQDVCLPENELFPPDAPVQYVPRAPVPDSALTAEDWAEDRAFPRALYRLALPIVLQSLLSAAVSAADVLMLAYVNPSALSATSLAGQVTFVLTLFFMGICTGVMILGAQYWGQKDLEAIEKIQGCALRNAGIVSLLFFLAALLLPQQLMRLFTPDPALIALGAAYLRVVGFSFLCMGASQVFLATLKSIERTKVSALISSACLLVNVAGNALAIFVVYPREPALAVQGVAGATVAARMAELLLCVLWFARHRMLRLRIQHVLRTEGWLRKRCWQCALPVQANYLIWGGALTVTSALMGHVSAEMIAASAIALSVRNLATVACTGLSNGGSILLGKHLGARRMALARRDGEKLRRWALLLGALAGLLLLLARPLALRMGGVHGQTRQLLDGMLFICACQCVGKAYNATLVAGVFAAGGDTRFGLACDTVVMWGLVLPLGYLFAFVLKAPPLLIFCVLCLDEYIKMPIVARRFRRYLWLQNLTIHRKEG